MENVLEALVGLFWKLGYLLVQQQEIRGHRGQGNIVFQQMQVAQACGSVRDAKNPALYASTASGHCKWVDRFDYWTFTLCYIQTGSQQLQ